MKLASWIISGSLLVGCAAARSQSADTQASLRAAVETHLAAIASRNMDALLATLTTGNTLTMIAPNGFMWDTPQQYVDFHRQWFATNDDGRLAFEIVRLIDSPALGHALIKYRYASKSSAGQPQAIESWLALTFALENGSWRLVFDQNTPLPSEASQGVEQAVRATPPPATAALLDARHISVSITRPSSEVYAFISDGENLGQWASGLGGLYQRAGEEWLVRGPLGTVRVRMAKKNDLGVADQDVTLDTGVTIHNPIRVVPNGTGSTVVFTLMRLAGVPEQKFNEDARWVEKDLATLKTILEKR